MIDLDKARAARREAEKEAPQLTVEGKVYDLPVYLPYEVLESIRGLQNEDTAAEALVTLAEALLGDNYDEVKKILEVEDLKDLVSGAMEEYGLNAPLDSSTS